MIARAAIGVALALCLGGAASFANGAERAEAGAEAPATDPQAAAKEAPAPVTAGEDPVRTELGSAKPVWYDPAHDDWRRVKIAPREQEAAPKPSSSGGPRVGGRFGFAYLLGALAIGLLAWLIVMAVRGRKALVFEQREVEAAPLRQVDISALAFTPREGRNDPEAALAAALRARDWSLAVLWIYTLMLVRLDRGGLIRLAPGKTNGTYRREAQAGSATTVSAFAHGIEIFERSYFGHQQVTERDVALLTEQQAALDAQLRGKAAP